MAHVSNSLIKIRSDLFPSSGASHCETNIADIVFEESLVHLLIQSSSNDATAMGLKSSFALMCCKKAIFEGNSGKIQVQNVFLPLTQCMLGYAPPPMNVLYFASTFSVTLCHHT